MAAYLGFFKGEDFFSSFNRSIRLKKNQRLALKLIAYILQIKKKYIVIDFESWPGKPGFLDFVVSLSITSSSVFIYSVRETDNRASPLRRS